MREMPRITDAVARPGGTLRRFQAMTNPAATNLTSSYVPPPAPSQARASLLPGPDGSSAPPLRRTNRLSTAVRIPRLNFDAAGALRRVRESQADDRIGADYQFLRRDVNEDEQEAREESHDVGQADRPLSRQAAQPSMRRRFGMRIDRDEFNRNMGGRIRLTIGANTGNNGADSAALVPDRSRVSLHAPPGGRIGVHGQLIEDFDEDDEAEIFSMFSYGSRNQSSSLPSLRIHSIGQVNVNYFDEEPGGVDQAIDIQDNEPEE